MPRVFTVRESLIIAGAMTALLLAAVGATLVVEGKGLIDASNDQVAAEGGDGPCNGHSACLSPGIDQPEGQLGLQYLIIGTSLLVVMTFVAIVLIAKAIPILRTRAPR
jgi:hypothetical protein